MREMISSGIKSMAFFFQRDIAYILLRADYVFQIQLNFT